MKTIMPFFVTVFLLSAFVTPISANMRAPTDLNAYIRVPFLKAITYDDIFDKAYDGKYIQFKCRFYGVMDGKLHELPYAYMYGEWHSPYSLPYEYKNSAWAGPIVLMDDSGNYTSQAVMPKAKADTLFKLKSADHVTVYARLEVHLVAVSTASTIHYVLAPYLIINEITRS
ncbi:MAG: hypothetical protein ACLQJ7_06505 [Syntrophobacteraceae bacterium]